MGSSCGKEQSRRKAKMKAEQTEKAAKESRMREIRAEWIPGKTYYENNGRTECRIVHSIETGQSVIQKTVNMPGDFIDIEHYTVGRSRDHPHNQGHNIHDEDIKFYKRLSIQPVSCSNIKPHYF
jgi:hypothetical protein